MSNIFNFHGNVNMNVYCKKCNINEEPDSGCGLEINSITVNFETGFIFELTNTSGTHVGVVITTNDAPIDLGCQETTSEYIISLENAQALFSGQTIVFTSYSDNCQTSTCEVIIPISFNQLEIPVTGENTTFELNGEPECTEDSSYSIVLAGPNSIIINNTNGNLTIPAQEIDSNGPGGVYIYYYLCGGEVVYFVMVFMANPQGPQQMYSCSGNNCIEDNNGQYNHSSCYGNCNGGPTMYSCDNGNCVEDENGEYNNDNCNGQCVLMYSCNGNDCVPDNDGTYFTSNCDWACEEPQLLGFIEFNNIGDSPVPGNSAEDWGSYLNVTPFTSVNIIGNKIEFYGVPIIYTQLVLSNITILDYDFSGFTYITDLYFSNVIGVTAIDNISITVEFLSLYNVDIVNLDLSVLVNLVSLIVNSSPTITSINIDNNILLENIQIFNIPLVTAIDVTNNLLLTSLSIETHDISVIDITLNVALEYLRIYNYGNYIINSIDLSNNINLSQITIVGTNIVSLDIAGLDLTSLDVHDNPLLTAIDLTDAPNLTGFTGNNTAITAIDTSNNGLLLVLNINSTPITSIDTSFNIVLGTLDLSHCSSLATYVFSSSLNTLYFADLPQFTTVDISACVNLLTFEGFLTPLSNIDITNNPLLNNIRLFAGAISDVNNINALLAYLVSINYTGYLDISAGTHAAPTGQGILDVATLIGNGATVITN